jgi:hypothetical protein
VTPPLNVGAVTPTNHIMTVGTADNTTFFKGEIYDIVFF